MNHHQQQHLYNHHNNKNQQQHVFALVTYPMFFCIESTDSAPSTPRNMSETGAEVARYELESLPAKRQVDPKRLAPGGVLSGWYIVS